MQHEHIGRHDSISATPLAESNRSRAHAHRRHREGNRPSFVDAAPPEEAERMYEAFCAALNVLVETGTFGARMKVELVNDGPVTILLGDG